jgi:hypothetical protein
MLEVSFGQRHVSHIPHDASKHNDNDSNTDNDNDHAGINGTSNAKDAD